MKSNKRTHSDELSHLVECVSHVIGAPAHTIPVSTRFSRKTPPLSAIHARELDNFHASPRLWNETLSLAADG